MEHLFIMTAEHNCRPAEVQKYIRISFYRRNMATISGRIWMQINKFINRQIMLMKIHEFRSLARPLLPSNSFCWARWMAKFSIQFNHWLIGQQNNFWHRRKQNDSLSLFFLRTWNRSAICCRRDGIFNAIEVGSKKYLWWKIVCSSRLKWTHSTVWSSHALFFLQSHGRNIETKLILFNLFYNWRGELHFTFYSYAMCFQSVRESWSLDQSVVRNYDKLHN